MKNILIINQQHTDNIGDQLIGESLRDLFRENNVEFQKYLIKNVDRDKCVIVWKIFDKIGLSLKVYDFIFGKQIKKIMKRREYDLAIIGGGELISNKWDFNSSMYAWTKRLKKRNIPICVMGVSGDEVSSNISKRYKKAFDRCEKVIVRDKLTKKQVEKYLKKEVEYCPDFVFSYDHFFNNNDCKKNIITAQIYCYEYIQGNYQNREEYFRYMFKLIESNKRDREVILSYSANEDKKEANNFVDFIQKEYKVQFEIAEVDSLAEYLDFMKSVETIITGRMHSMIIALLMKSNIIPVTTKDKIKQFEQEWLINSNVIAAKSLVNNKVSEIKNTYLIENNE